MPQLMISPKLIIEKLYVWDMCENKKTVGIKGRTYPVDNNSLFQRFMKEL